MKGKGSVSPRSITSSKITATISISLVLFLLGLIVMLSLFANELSTYVKENITFDIVLNDNMDFQQIKDFQKDLDTSPFVKSTKYISKADAAKQTEAELGMNPEEFLGYNPLPSIIEIRLKSAYANPDSIAAVETHVKTMTNNVREISYRKELMQTVNENMKKIGLAVGGLALLLLIISFVLINNTIRLTIYSKRFLIYTMRLVGATDAFITKPFLKTNIGTGIAAAVIAIALLLGLIYYISQGIADFMGLIDINTLLTVCASVVVLGIGISIFATYFAVKKYLKMRRDDLYYI